MALPEPMLKIKLNENFNQNVHISYKKMDLKMLSSICQPYCLGPNVLMY